MKRVVSDSNGGTGTSVEVKLHTLEISLALQRRGWSLPECKEIFDETSYSPSLRTLQRGTKKLKEDKTPLSIEKNSGRKRKLSKEQELIVCGAVFAQEDCVGLLFVQEWVKANFDIDL